MVLSGAADRYLLIVVHLRRCCDGDCVRCCFQRGIKAVAEPAESPYQTPQYPNEKSRTSGPLLLILLGVIAIAAAIAIGNYRYRQALRAEAAAIQARRAAQAQLQKLEEQAATQSGEPSSAQPAE